MKEKETLLGQNIPRRSFLGMAARTLGALVAGRIVYEELNPIFPHKEKSYLGHNLDNLKLVEDFWRENLPSSEAELMIKITELESGYNQFEKDGSVYRGRQNPNDMGIMQINEKVWGKKANELGFDLHDTKGNLQMALWIYQNEGPQKWAVYKKAKREIGG